MHQPLSIIPQQRTEIKSLLDAALDLASKGYPVFPLRPGTKEPATTNGFHAATTDLDQIRQWWSQNPDYNIGIAATELLVVDLDAYKPEAQESKQTLFGGFVPVDIPAVLTPSGGFHYYVRVAQNWAGEWGIGNNVDLLPGLDLKGCGRGYVVAPGSVVAGRSYELAGGWTELPPLDQLPLLPEQTRRAIEQIISNRKPANGNGNGNGHNPQTLPPHTTVDMQEIERCLLQLWTRGRRQALALAIAGMLRKMGVTEKECSELIARVSAAAGDEETEKRMAAVRDTYASPNVAGWTLLAPDEQAAIAPALRQTTRQLRQIDRTDAEPSGAGNQTGNPESHATDNPGANTAPPRKPTRPAPQPWQSQRPKPATESADTVGDGSGPGSSLAGEAALPPVLAALEDQSGELSPHSGDSTPSIYSNIVLPNKNVTIGYTSCNDRLHSVKRSATQNVTIGYTSCNDRLRPMTVAEMILGHVGDRGSASLEDLLSLIGCSRGAARQALRRLTRSGKLERRGTLYFLPSSDDNDYVSPVEYAQRNGISSGAARVKLMRMVESGRALRLAHGQYFVLPEGWQLVEAAWNPCAVRRDQRGREYYELELCEPIGSVRIVRFYMNETRYTALCEASEIVDIERRSCRVAIARKFRGGRSVYDCVAIIDKSGSRLLWREREKD
jgi:hypothetical protein